MLIRELSPHTDLNGFYSCTNTNVVICLAELSRSVGLIKVSKLFSFY